MSDDVDMVDAFVQAEAAIREHVDLDDFWTGLEDQRESWWTVTDGELHYSTDRGEVERVLSTEGEDLGSQLYGGPVRMRSSGGVARGTVYCCVPYDTQQGFDCTPIFLADHEVKP